jgi:hypothetical protein
VSDAAAPGTRKLEFMKSNYSALAEQIELQWMGGHYRRPIQGS